MSKVDDDYDMIFVYIHIYTQWLYLLNFLIHLQSENICFIFSVFVGVDLKTLVIPFPAPSTLVRKYCMLN